MNATNINYGELRKAYPKVMSKEQFRIAAHISKATALYLLESGHVPCQDTHKKTHRYLIKTADVISYLINREIEPENIWLQMVGMKNALGASMKINQSRMNFYNYRLRAINCSGSFMKAYCANSMTC